MKDLQKYILESSKNIENKGKGAFKNKFKYSQSDWNKWLDSIYSGKLTKHVMIGNDPDNGCMLIYFVNGEKMTHVATYIPKTQVLYCDDMHLFGNEVKESAEDGKDGHNETFVDPDTGEITTMWVPDPDPELEKLKWEAYEKEEAEASKLREKIGEQEKDLIKQQEKLEDKLWEYEQELKDTNRQYRQLQIDQEDELGQLYSSGKEAEAEEKAQEYGEQFNKLADEIESLKANIKKLQPQIAKIEAQRDKLWEPYYKLDDELLEKWRKLTGR